MIDPSKGIFLKEVDSTNNFILSHGVNGSFVVSEIQTSGRGRNSRTWLSSEPNNLYFSALVQLDSFINLPLLSLLCGKAIHKTCKDFFPKSNLTIKWPNDIYSEDKKISGVLLETRTQKESISLIIGIGVNFYFSNLPENIPNIGMLMNEPPSVEFKKEFVKKLIFELNQILISSYHSDLVKQDLSYVYEHSYLKNKKIQFDIQENIFIGDFLGYDENGFLLVRVQDQIYKLQDTTKNFGVIKNDERCITGN
ncbi:MAG: biotin--[acetyl-CoA-carboxylase] ligase [Leptospiraceae bacterium]|nr:biotin--[acetyl-CoA-carboxylase] ligase [Leptospiraceae bacterium]